MVEFKIRPYLIARMKAFRFILLAIIFALAPVVFLFVRAQGMTYSNWLFVPATLIWLLLLSFWYLGFGGDSFKKRARNFGIGLISFIVLAFALSKLLRYEGSTSGSSFPKFTWVWQDDWETPEALESSAEPVSDPGITRESLEAAAADLLQFFGPDRNAMWPSAAFATDWSGEAPIEVWRRPVGAGWSSFTVAGGRAITQEQIGDNETVSCFDLFTGKTLWQHSDDGVRLLLAKADQPMAEMGGEGPRSTPTIHSGKVYSLGATGIINCLELKTGKKIWSRDVLKDINGVTHDWGVANAPLILQEQGTVVLPGSKAPGVTLLALDLETGETRWTHEGKGATYSSARVIEFFGTPQIVSVNLKDVTGHDPETGQALWTYDWPGNYPRVGQPNKIGDDQLLLTASYGLGSPLLKLSKDGDSWAVERVWNSNRLKTKFSSAAIIGDYAYGLDEARLACINLTDGRIAWKGEKYGFGQHLLFGEHLLIQAEQGEVVIGRLTPEGFTETGRIDDALSSMTWNTPSVAGRLLLVRNDKEAVCYLLPAP